MMESRVRRSRRDLWTAKYGSVSRRYRRVNWGDCHLESIPRSQALWRRESHNGQFPCMNKIQGEIDQAKYSTSSKGEGETTLRPRPIEECPDNATLDELNRDNSARINLGDSALEHSLPSWVSDHLGGKSYITDDIDQSLSSPFKGSPQGSSSVYTEHPKMDTSTLTKETNIMTQDDLDNLRKKYSFPPGIQLRIPREGETILSTQSGKLAFYEAAFPAGLRFPIHPIVRRILSRYKICPTQLSPNAWQFIVYSLMIWRYYKRHMSCDEFKSLYSLSPLPYLGWYYFKERPDKNLLRGSPSNVKVWKKRFFFASEDEWEFFPSMPPGEEILKSYNKLPTLTENEVKRMEGVLGKIGPGGYFEVSKVLDSKTFKKFFTRSRMEVSSSGGENTASGNEGRIAMRAFPDIPDLTLLRWLGGKVPYPFSFSSIPSPSSDSKLDSLSDSGLPPELRSDAMSSRINLSTLTKKAGEKKAVTKDASSAATSQPPLKGLADNLGHRASMMSSAPVAQKILNGVIFPADKEKVDYFTMDELVTKSFHALGQLACADSAELEMVKAQNRASQVEGQLANLGEKAMKTEAELKDKSEVVARLEVEVAELTSKYALVKKLAVEEFKSSDDFKEAVAALTASYFGEGFEFCKRQLLHQNPNLGVDVVSMEMDAELAEEEEAAKVGEKEEDNEANAAP
ncbi:hypothetical protein Acr_00g0099640 [Actinidia rufa]|uniref:Transposase (putative) gypsy type domain-containing protein n=1 Tax=Actinidia rufa TaxID=165716 RepID=A0A7J0E1D4_9ERIC|nr:hypothetical protein Acr_00g0099640 [Actinidia rufa]